MGLRSAPTGHRDTTGRVAIVGSINADLTVHTERRPRGGETVLGSDLVIGSGGKGANQAAAAARLGADVAMLGAVGADGFGRDQRAALLAEGIDGSAIVELDGVATGTAVIVVDAAGENSIVVSPGANGRITPAMIDRQRDWFSGAAVLGLCLEIPLDSVLAAARHGHAAGTQVILNLSPYAKVPSELLTLTDLLLVNSHELAQLLATAGSDAAAEATSWAARARALGSLGIRRAVVTLGGDGSIVLDRLTGPDPQLTSIAAVPVTPVDTTGCGDAYMGAVAAALAANQPLDRAAAVASRISAAAATRPGAQNSYPGAAEAAALATDAAGHRAGR
jgi:ribokinase